MTYLRRAFDRGYAALFAKLGYDVSTDSREDQMPGRHTLVAATDPAENQRRSNNIGNAFNMNAQFASTSSMGEPASVNPSLNATVGSGSFSNQTDSLGGAS